MHSERLVAGLAQVGRADVATAGGKAANLGELIRGGFAVPDGFVVLTGSYRTAMDAAGLGTPAGSSLAGGSMAAGAREIREAVAAMAVPAAVELAVRAACRELGEGPVAVRSSATAEDLPGATFAGHQDSYLNIVGADAVVDAVRRCWASLWTERAVSYRNKAGVDHGQVQIAVVVQRMVDADAAGVAFTANPVTGVRGETVINASVGLGEAVVSGLVTPDQFVVSGGGLLLSERRGRREVVIRAKADGGTEPVTGGAGSAAGGAAAPAIDAPAVLRLAEVCARIERHFGGPQDIEWAVAGGRLWIVQARPLTALPPEPVAVNPVRKALTGIFVELLPVRPYPMDMSTWTVHGHGRILTRMLGEIPGLKLSIEDILPETGGIVREIVPPRPRPTLRTLTAPFRLVPKMGRYRPELWMQDRRFTLFDQAAVELADRDAAGMHWRDLVAAPGRALQVLDGFISLRIDHLPRVGFDLARLRAMLAVAGLGREFSGLIAAGDTRTGDANRELRTLAALVAAEPQWRAAFMGRTGAELDALIDSEPSFEPLKHKIGDFFKEYGHRETTSAFLVSEPTWADDPHVLLGAVRALLAQPAGSESEPLAEAAQRRVEQCSRVPRRLRTAILAASRDARSGIAFREDSHFHALRLLPPIRRAVLEAGARLAASGALPAPAAIFHLRIEEITAIADPGRLTPAQRAELRGLVEGRMQRRALLAGAPLISPLTLKAGRDQGQALVSGTPAGGGRATGPVRIISGPGSFSLLKPGEIMVCPYTNPSWTPLFQLAAGIVVDTGGAASHAAIVAREYGLAAVMGTGTGTSVLYDGQLVSVDGTTGQVTPAEQA